MRSGRRQLFSTRRLAAVPLLVLMLCAPVAIADRPIKERPEAFVGWEVDKTTKGDVCTIASKDECQPGVKSSEPGGFKFPVGVATGPPPEDLVYVADRSNSRIQVFTAGGVLVGSFGWEVDETTKGNVCTVESHDVCQAGVTGGAAGQFDQPYSIAVNQTNGDLYVWDQPNHRVEKYSPAGKFLLTFGGKVNKEGGDICVDSEETQCQAGVVGTAPGEFGGFNLERGNLIAIGPRGDVYVANEERIQEFGENGEYETSISLAGRAEAVATNAAGEIFAIEEGGTLRKFSTIGIEVTSAGWPFRPTAENATEEKLALVGLAIDPVGRLATTGLEEYILAKGGRATRSFGLLVNSETTGLITEFATGVPATGLTFGGNEVGGKQGYSMFAVQQTEQEVAIYSPVPVAELISLAASCSPGPENESDVTLTCSLNGDVNAWGVPKTEVWFQYGRTCSLGSETPKQPIQPLETLEPVTDLLAGEVRPNEPGFCYRLVAEDENVESPEQLVSPRTSFSTPLVSPKTTGAPETTISRPSSAVLFDELNPENARTEYFFEYAPEAKAGAKLSEECPNGIRAERQPCEEAGVLVTPSLESTTYGKIGTTAEATGLQPSTRYRYRLFSESENTAKTEKRTNLEGQSTAEREQFEGVMETAPKPTVSAQTGASTNVTATSAVISGDVNPDGQAAAYDFELGLYNGASTQYGVVVTGNVPPSSGPVEEAQQLTGLQPGTTYAYRVAVKSGYGESTGAPALFTTSGLPTVLSAPVALPFLVLPKIAFPVSVKKGPAPKCRHGFRRNKHDKCTKIRPKHRSKKSTAKRAARNTKRQR